MAFNTCIVFYRITYRITYRKSAQRQTATVR